MYREQKTTVRPWGWWWSKEGSFWTFLQPFSYPTILLSTFMEYVCGRDRTSKWWCCTGKGKGEVVPVLN